MFSFPSIMSAAASSPAAPPTFSLEPANDESALARRQAAQSHADTAAELSSINKDTLQSIRLNELRACFQFDNAKLGVPYLPTELLSIVNEYCAPLAGFRRLVAVAHHWDRDLRIYSEPEFRALAKDSVLEETGLLKFLRWRERALAKYFAREAGEVSGASTSASASASASAHASSDADPTTSGGGSEGDLQAEEEPAGGWVSRTMSIARTEEMYLDEMCAEVRGALTHRQNPSNGEEYAHERDGSPAGSPRRWDLAFANAFFSRFNDANLPAHFQEDLIRWLYDEPDEIRRRLLAADPYCDIQQLARIVDDDSLKHLDDGGHRDYVSLSRSVFADETKQAGLWALTRQMQS